MVVFRTGVDSWFRVPVTVTVTVTKSRPPLVVRTALVVRVNPGKFAMLGLELPALVSDVPWYVPTIDV